MDHLSWQLHVGPCCLYLPHTAITVEPLFLLPPSRVRSFLINKRRAHDSAGLSAELHALYLICSTNLLGFLRCGGGLMVFPVESSARCLESCGEQPRAQNMNDCTAVATVNAFDCMTSVSPTEHGLGNAIGSTELSKCVCGFVCVSVCASRVHNAGSAESSLHRLLACTTALLSSLISSVNVSL